VWTGLWESAGDFGEQRANRGTGAGYEREAVGQKEGSVDADQAGRQHVE